MENFTEEAWVGLPSNELWREGSPGYDLGTVGDWLAATVAEPLNMYPVPVHLGNAMCFREKWTPAQVYVALINLRQGFLTLALTSWALILCCGGLS